MITEGISLDWPSIDFAIDQASYLQGLEDVQIIDDFLIILEGPELLDLMINPIYLTDIDTTGFGILVDLNEQKDIVKVDIDGIDFEEGQEY